jgi:hypothetical protein
VRVSVENGAEGEEETVPWFRCGFQGAWATPLRLCLSACLLLVRIFLVRACPPLGQVAVGQKAYSDWRLRVGLGPNLLRVALLEAPVWALVFGWQIRLLDRRWRLAGRQWYKEWSVLEEMNDGPPSGSILKSS